MRPETGKHRRQSGRTVLPAHRHPSRQGDIGQRNFRSTPHIPSHPFALLPKGTLLLFACVGGLFAAYFSFHFFRALFTGRAVSPVRYPWLGTRSAYFEWSSEPIGYLFHLALPGLAALVLICIVYHFVRGLWE